jgi:hypothetical protein
MFKFSKRTATPSNSDFEHSVMHSAANSSQAAGDVQRELVRVAFKDTLRATGVPAQWLDCEVNFIQSVRYGERIQVQLVVKKWSGLLLRHSLAFQHALAQCLDRYEPHVDHSQHEWTWKFAADCDTPFPDMPAPEDWAAKLRVAQARPAAVGGQPAPAKVAAKATAKPVSTATASAQPPSKAFEMRDIFSDLTVEQLKANKT